MKNLYSSNSCNFFRGLVKLFLGVFVIFPGLVCAACNIVTSSTDVDFGKVPGNSLALSEIDGYRRIGTRQLTINGTCDLPQQIIRIAFDGMQAIPGKKVVRWGEGGALLFRAERASVNGISVPLTVLGATNTISGGSVDLLSDSIIDLDLGKITPDARKSFVVQLTIIGLLPTNHVMSSQLVLTERYSVRLVGSR